MVQQLKNGKYNPIVPVIHGWGYVPMVNDDGSLVECDCCSAGCIMSAWKYARWNGKCAYQGE